METTHNSVKVKLGINVMKQNRSTEGCSKLKRSVDMASSGKNGLNIRTNASPMVWFPWSICNGCGMPAGNAYPCGHLVPFPILGLANAPIVETKFLELAMSLLDFSPRIPLGTFSIFQKGTGPCVRRSKRPLLASRTLLVESLIGWEVTVGQVSECHLTFVRGRLRIAE